MYESIMNPKKNSKSKFRFMTDEIIRKNTVPYPNKDLLSYT